MGTKRYQCERCGRAGASHTFIHTGSQGDTLLLCIQCFNAQMAKHAQIENFDNREIDPITMTDANGLVHEFHFQTRLLGPMVVTDAFELIDGVPGGYQFREIGDPQEERYEQLGRLVKKMRKALAATYLQDTEQGMQFRGMEVRGHITSYGDNAADPFAPTSPVVVIDGREVSWEEFGRMLMTFEGYDFKLQIRETGESLDGNDDHQ